MPSIGKDLAAKIEEILETDHLSMLDRLKRSMPAELADLTRIPGLGPKRVKLIYEKLDIGTAKHLRAAAEKGRLRNLPGIGEKTEKAIREHFSATGHRTAA